MSPCHTINKESIRLTSTCFSVIRDKIRKDRKMMVNFKPVAMRKLFIQSVSLEPSFVSLRSMEVLVGR